MQQSSEPHPQKILIVDDNRIIRHLLRLTFDESARFQIFEANTGDDALPIALRERPNVIILDVMMPGKLNGLQVCDIIKTLPETQHCKVILLSAKCQQADLQSGREVKADHYVTKPFSPKKLLELVESISLPQDNV